MIKFRNGKKAITIVTLYRMLNTSTNGIHTSRAQQNRVGKKIKIAAMH